MQRDRHITCKDDNVEKALKGPLGPGSEESSDHISAREHLQPTIIFNFLKTHDNNLALTAFENPEESFTVHIVFQSITASKHYACVRVSNLIPGRSDFKSIARPDEHGYLTSESQECAVGGHPYSGQRQ